MKKINLLFILVLSAFLLFSCSSNDDEEELADTAWNGSSQGSDSGDSLPDAITDDNDKTDTVSTSDNDEKTDTVSEYDDSDTSDPAIPDNDITDSDDNSDTTTDTGDSEPGDNPYTDSGDSETGDNPDTDSGDSEPGDNPDTDSGDSDTDDNGDTLTPETPAFPQCSPSSAKPCILGKLIWSETKKTKLSQGGCNTQCTNLNEGGYSSGWRLPTINELRTLVQNCSKTVSLPEGVCQVSNTCNTTSCKTESDCKCSSGADYSKLGDTDSLWSSTKNDQGAWYINFFNAYIDSTLTSEKKSARCVHEIE